MNVMQILLMLRLRWWLIIVMPLITGVVAAAITVRLPKQYTSEAVLLMDVKSDPLLATFMPAASPLFLSTQLEIIQGTQVARIAVKKMGLDKNPEMIKIWRSATSGRLPIDEYYAGVIGRGLTVESAKNSSLVKIRYTGSDPNFVAAAANSFANAYIDFSIDLRVAPARSYANYYDERYNALKTEFETLRDRLTEAKRSKGLYFNNEEYKIELDRLETLTKRLSEAQAQVTEYDLALKNAAVADSKKNVITPTEQALKTEIQRTEDKIAEVKLVYGENHPARKQVEDTLKSLKSRLEEESNKSRSLDVQNREVLRKKVMVLEAEVEAQKARMEKDVKGQDDLTFLIKEMDLVQKSLDAIATRRSQLQLESSSEQPIGKIITQATPALIPSSPNNAKNVLVGIGAGLGLGCAIAVLLEMIGRRVRSAMDLTGLADVPFLGSVGHIEKKKKFSFLF